MTLEEILATVESEQTKEAIVNAINAEKEKGISEYRKKDTEVLKYKGLVKELGYDPEKFESVDSFIESKKKTVSESNLTIAQLNDKLNSYMTELETERETSRQIQKKAKENKLNADLTGKIGNMFYGAEFMIKTLITDGVADIQDDKTVIKDGDRVLSLDEGINLLKDKYKDSLKTSQVAGSGDSGGSKSQPQKEKSFAEQMAERLKTK